MSRSTKESPPAIEETQISVATATRIQRFCCIAFTRHIYEGLASTAKKETLEPALLLLACFQEILRRYTGQARVVVAFDEVWPHVSHVALEDNLSVRNTVLLLQSKAKAPNSEDSLTSAMDGQFSFRKAQDPPRNEQLHSIRSPIHCSLCYSETALEGFLEYDDKAWDPGVIENLAKCYQHLVLAALSDLDLPIGQIDLLNETALQLLNSWNCTDSSYPRLRVDQLFEQKAEEVPGYPALTFSGNTITYGALLKEVNSLATGLRSMGVGPGSLVGICMQRCSEMVIAMLAVFRAGAAYLPLDPDFPPERIAFEQENAQPLAIITQAALCERFSFGPAQVLLLDSLSMQNASASQLDIPARLDQGLDDLAYVLYTSGSTGKPKGVQVTHRALTNLLTSVAGILPLTDSDVILATSTISFDISVFEIFAPLISGAHVVIAPRSTAISGELLAVAIQESGATLLQATPSGWRILLESGWQGQPGLKMLTAGEPLDKTLAERLLNRGDSLWNLYGPTEATIYATGRKMAKHQARITVGIPLPNYTTYVVDRHQKRVPIGAVGELYLGGVGVARGYLDRPSLTSEKFIPDCFGGKIGGYLYRTGDLARFLPDGQIELLGRADSQIKLRGYRIELEEIEGLLDSHPCIKKSMVKVIDFGEGDGRLVAYVVAARKSAPLDAGQLREYAQRALPSYMVPASFFAIDSLALTPNGKVDRKAPPNLSALQILGSSSSSEAPADELTLAVTNVWRSALNVNHVSLDDNFFESGGHSLLAARMFTEIGRALGLKLPVSMLIEAPTPRLLTERIRKTQHSPMGCLVPMQPNGSLPPLYLIHHLHGDILVYRALAQCFPSERPVIGIQAPLGLTDGVAPCSVESLAARYVREILAQHTTGPFHLAGFSTGGILAFELARQFTQAGYEVGLLALIDADINAPGPVLSKAAKYAKVSLRKLCKIVFKFRDEAKEGPKQFVAKRFAYWRLLWQLRRLKTSSSSSGSKLSVDQVLLLAEQSYCPKTYWGAALLLRFHDEAWDIGPDPLLGWSTLIQGGIEVVDVPGGHNTGMSSSRAARMAALLAARMENVELVDVEKASSHNAAVPVT